MLRNETQQPLGEKHTHIQACRRTRRWVQCAAWNPLACLVSPASLNLCQQAKVRCYHVFSVHINKLKITVAESRCSWPQLASAGILALVYMSLTAVNWILFSTSAHGERLLYTQILSSPTGTLLFCSKTVFNVNLFSFHLPTRTNTGVIASECGILLFIIHSACVFPAGPRPCTSTALIDGSSLGSLYKQVSPESHVDLQTTLCFLHEL